MGERNLSAEQQHYTTRGRVEGGGGGGSTMADKETDPVLDSPRSTASAAIRC